MLRVKQSRRRWFETPSRSLLCHCNVCLFFLFIPRKYTYNVTFPTTLFNQHTTVWENCKNKISHPNIRTHFHLSQVVCPNLSWYQSWRPHNGVYSLVSILNSTQLDRPNQDNWGSLYEVAGRTSVDWAFLAAFFSARKRLYVFRANRNSVDPGAILCIIIRCARTLRTRSWQTGHFRFLWRCTGASGSSGIASWKIWKKM